MLVELHVRDLGVIADLNLVLGGGMTALTGETGAGKTLIVEALELLVGGRADPAIVRAGAEEALVEGRFVDQEGNERTLARSIPAAGRSRAYLDGRMCPVAALAEAGVELLDLHGQHAHQSLLRPATQRASLDQHGKVDLGEVRKLERSIRDVLEECAALGGDARQLAREVDLLSYQLREIDNAAVRSPSEIDDLLAEEEVLASAAELTETARDAHTLLAGGDADGDGGDRRAPAGGSAGGRGAVDAVAESAAMLRRHGPLNDVAERLASLAADLDDVSSDLRRRTESFEEDPERLSEVRERRYVLADLQRKYGESLADVLEFAGTVRLRLEEISGSEERRVKLAAEEAELLSQLGEAEEAVAAARVAAAETLARDLEEIIRRLAMPEAAIEVRVGGNRRGDEVEFFLGANPGEPGLPLTKVASGGELARAMLALRLVLTAGPPTLVFDEVDAGIGGAASVAVGRALGEIGRRHQVLVVTHLAQVASFADCQIAVTKQLEQGRTVTFAKVVSGDERVAELTRMLSGEPQSESGRLHAAELLEMRSRSGSSG